MDSLALCLILIAKICNISVEYQFVLRFSETYQESPTNPFFTDFLRDLHKCQVRACNTIFLAQRWNFIFDGTSHP